MAGSHRLKLLFKVVLFLLGETYNLGGLRRYGAPAGGRSGA
jgi:hypothetical protein